MPTLLHHKLSIALFAQNPKSKEAFLEIALHSRLHAQKQQTMSAWAQRTKLRGEIVLLEREQQARKKQFGVDLWDVIDSVETRRQHDILPTPFLFKGIEEKIKKPLEDCSRDTAAIYSSISEKETDLEVVQARRARTADSGVGSWISNGSQETKLQAELALLKRNAKIRKEEFGVEIWESVSEDKSITATVARETKDKGGALGKVGGAIGGIGKTVASGVTSGLGKLSDNERAIQACVKQAKDDMEYLQRSIERKRTMIESLS